MNQDNLQEQYEILRREEEKDRRKTIIIVALCLLIVLITILGIWFSYKRPGTVCSLNCDLNGDGVIDTNIDLDDDDICDVNCVRIDKKTNKEYIINMDYNGDRKPHFNLDTDNDGKPDTNLVNKDINSDGICDFNCDTNKDGKPDSNIDFDNDNVCDLNCKWTDKEGNDVITNQDNDKDGICDLNCDTNNDGVCDYNCDTSGNGECDWNCYLKDEDVCDLNCDTNNDGKCDLNCQIKDENGKDIIINVDQDKDGVCDLNCDTNGDGKCDLFCQVKDEDGKDIIINIDNDKDGVCDLNCDVNNDNACDFNCDTNNDNKADINIDFDNDGFCDLNCDTNNDGVCDYNCDTNNNGKCDEANCITNDKRSATLRSLSVDGYDLIPEFKPSVSNYTVTIKDNVSSVVVKAEATSVNANISGIGTVKLNDSETKVQVVVKAPAGNTKTYTITIIKKVDSGGTEIESPEGVLLTLVSYKSIEAKDIFPGWKGTQEFVIKNDTNKTLVYKINLLVDKNDFTSSNFKYSLIKNGIKIVPQTTAPKSNATIFKDLIIAPGDSAKFEVNYEFVDTGSEQNIDQGRNYSARTEVVVTAVSSSLVK